MKFKTSNNDFWATCIKGAFFLSFFKCKIPHTGTCCRWDAFFGPQNTSTITKKETHAVFFFFLVLKCCWTSDSVSNAIVKTAQLALHCVCTSHILSNTERLKSTSSKHGSLKAIFLLSIELELLWSLIKIKVKLFYFLPKDLGKTNSMRAQGRRIIWAQSIYHSKWLERELCLTYLPAPCLTILPLQISSHLHCSCKMSQGMQKLKFS